MDKIHEKWLLNIFGQKVKFNEPMSRHVSFRVGGPADAFVTPKNENELLALVHWVKENHLPYFIIGGGSNLLIKDNGLRAVVISLKGCLKEIHHQNGGRGTVIVQAGSGANLHTLCGYALKQGYKGMNFALGIPGTVGGGIMMNAGTWHGNMENVIHAITVITSEGRKKRIERNRLQFGYRTCRWTGDEDEVGTQNPLILMGDFLLERGDKNEIQSEAEALLKNRRSSQPVDQPSAGCFFKNPISGKPAGVLIDMAGLKGKRVGDAEVSTLHANYIINKGKATAAQILELKDIIQETVFKKYNVKLETEVKIVGT